MSDPEAVVQAEPARWLLLVHQLPAKPGYPRVKVWALYFGRLPLQVPAMYAIGFWILLQVGSAFLSGDQDVGWFAHLGGLAAGAALTPMLRRRYDPVLARAEVSETRG